MNESFYGVHGACNLFPIMVFIATIIRSGDLEFRGSVALSAIAEQES